MVDHGSVGLVDQLLGGCAGGVDQVVVVDCTPGDPGLRAVCDRHGARLIEPGANLGYGGGANLGAEQLEADVLVVANPDVEVSADGLRRLAAAAWRNGLAGPRLEFPDGGLQRSAHRREPRGLTTAYDLSVPFRAVAARVSRDWHPTLLSTAAHASSASCVHVLGALVAVDAQAFREVGGFDPAFFLYREETDLCHRLRAAGWQVLHEASVTAVHHSGGSTTDPRPLAARPLHLASHYRYLRTHWGRLAAARNRIVGLLAALSSVVTGPERGAWWGAVRWHLRGR